MKTENKITIKDNMTVLFFGDSITDNGRDYSDPLNLGADWSRSHPVLMSKFLSQKYPDYSFTFYNRGINGHTSWDLLQRVEQDCICLKPDLIVLLVGVNDIWSYGDDDNFTEENYSKLICEMKTKLPEAQLIVLSPFLFSNVDSHDYHRPHLERKIEIIKKYAQPAADIFIETDKFLNSVLNKYIVPQCLSFDGVHLTEAGYIIITREILNQMGQIEY